MIAISSSIVWPSGNPTYSGRSRSASGVGVDLTGDSGQEDRVFLFEELDVPAQLAVGRGRQRAHEGIKQQVHSRRPEIV